MANRSTLKEAMAEALAIRETAIENAHDQLKESLTPHFKDLLAAKLREMDEEDEKERVVAEEADEDVDEGHNAEADDDSEESEEEADDEVPGDLPDEEMPEDGEPELEIKDMEVEDLKDLIRDILATEMGGEEGEPEDEYGDEPPMDDEPVDMVGADEDEIDLSELLRELESLANEGKKDKEVKKPQNPFAVSEAKASKEVAKLKKELNEVYAQVSTLKDSLKEYATFNAKLLYLNKVFKKYNLTESQKVAVVSAFDKAKSKKDAELIYETVIETYSTVANNTTNRVNENRGFASKATGNSTKPKGDVIAETSDVIRRMQKLAGIITG